MELPQVKRNEFITKLKKFIEKKYKKEISRAAQQGKAFELDVSDLDKSHPDIVDFLKAEPDEMFKITEEAISQIDLSKPVKVRFKNHPEITNIRDLRAKHIGKFLCVEGVVRRSSEIRPEIMATVWSCPECGTSIEQEARFGFTSKPFKCPECGNNKAFKQIESKLRDTRRIVIDEPFELTEGEKPSQLNIILQEDLCSPDGRRMTDPGNRLKITGILRDIPQGKIYSSRLDFYFEANHIEPTEVGWERVEISKEDEEKIKALAKNPAIYKMFIDSLAPSLYGLEDVKESIILQLFGGVPRKMKDGTRVRGDIHILLLGDPASGKSQLLKLVPKMVPRGKYVSGKGVTTAGLCMAYDTLIPLSHGKITPIGDLVEEALRQKKEKADGFDGFVSTKGNVEVWCIDPKTLKLKKKRVSKFFKLKPHSRLIKITTRSGREIKLTQENPVLTIENGRVIWKAAKELALNDYVALARHIPLNHAHIDNIDPDFAMFVGMIAGDGYVGDREVRFYNIDENRLKWVYAAGKNLGLNPRIYSKSRTPYVRMASKELCDRLKREFSVNREEKSHKIEIPHNILMSNEALAKFISGLFDCDGCVIEKDKGSYIEYTTVSEKMAREIQTALLRFGIMSYMRKKKPSEKGFGGKKLKYVISIYGKRNLRLFQKYIGFNFSKKEQLNKILIERSAEETNVDVIPNIGTEINKLRKALGIKIKGKEGLEHLRYYEHGRRKFTRKGLQNFLVQLKKQKKHEYFDYLWILSNSDLFWDSIKKIEFVDEEWVYDMTVDDEHNFIANDLIIHNTATVLKDEQFMGGWVLEAGAIVLANKGIIAIDEFEKMSPDDSVAMHEALEQGSVSIAKASIVATLPAETSVLAGGNPKFSRFDPMMPIMTQITIIPTLLSRFDLKFILKDTPDAVKDRLVVEHMLKTRGEENFEGARPKLESEFIKKYIAYAKERFKPKLTSEAGKILKSFYLNLRKKAEQEGSSVPITLRQFEAMIRLAEASAKIQLSNVVRKEDAKRAIRLMEHSVKQMGLDPKTGKIDIDLAEGGTPSSERSMIRMVVDLINHLSEKKKEISVAEIINEASKQGIEDVEGIIEKLKREGVLFEPSSGYVQKV